MLGILAQMTAIAGRAAVTETAEESCAGDAFA
jgi:hypothetical protein